MWCVGRPVTSHVCIFRFIDQTSRADRESHSVPPRSAREARSEQSCLSQMCNKPSRLTSARRAIPTRTMRSGRRERATVSVRPSRRRTEAVVSEVARYVCMQCRAARARARAAAGSGVRAGSFCRRQPHKTFRSFPAKRACARATSLEGVWGRARQRLPREFGRRRSR